MDTQQIEESAPQLPPGNWTNRPLTMADLESVLERFGATFATALNKSQRRKITIGEYDPKSAFHPNKATAVKFRPDTTFFQNGVQLEWHNVRDAEVALWNRIERPGRYIDRRVMVLVRDEAGQREVSIRYRNSKVDDRLDNARHWSSAEQLLQKIVDEQDAIVAKEQENENLLKRFQERERREQAEEETRQQQKVAAVRQAASIPVVQASEGEVVDIPNEGAYQAPLPRKSFGKSKKFQAALAAADAKANAKRGRRGKK